MSVISGKEYLLDKIFSGDFAYTIPAGQRPYSWEEEHAEVLFDNLYDFFCDNPPTDNADNDNYYFLGSIVITKKDKNPNSEVIDGQQRLITLTILFSVIAGYLDGNFQSNWYNRIWETGDPFSPNPVVAPRLKIRFKDQAFFEDKIQRRISGGNKLSELKNFVKDTTDLPEESQMHIRANCGVLIKKMDDTFSVNGQIDVNRLIEFCKFLMSRCYIVVVATDNNDTSYRVFTIINTTGMDLLPTDVLKASVIGKISPKSQQNYADKWEDLETDATRQGFRDMFAHIRMIYSKKKAQGSLLKEFDQFVMPKVENAAKLSNTNPAVYLIDKILTPYTMEYKKIKNPGVPLTNDDVNYYLMWLNKLDNDDWVPATMKFFADKSDPDYRLWFAKKMERLSAYMHITSYTINERILRYEKIFNEMEEKPAHSLAKPLKSIELDDDEKKDFLNALDGEIYRLTPRRRSYVILRLDSFVATGQVLNYNPKILSIEHVLPQTVDENSQWAKWWKNPDEREKWIHKIANLVPLTRRKNSSAQNFDFATKKTSYFSKGGTISYPLTTQVVNEKDWKPSTVEARQKNLLDTFKKNWEL